MYTESNGDAIFVERRTARLSEENERLRAENAQLKDQLYHDRLHKEAWSRPGFEAFFPGIFEQAKAKGIPLVAVVADLDNFKRANDQFGHAKGDNALTHVLDVLVNTLRAKRSKEDERPQQDFVARLGGDEIVIIMTNTTIEQAMTAMHRTRAAIAATSLTVVSHEATHPITISYGLAQLSDTDRTPDQLLERADKAMYFAKNHGTKNNVAAYMPDGLIIVPDEELSKKILDEAGAIPDPRNLVEVRDWLRKNIKTPSVSFMKADSTGRPRSFEEQIDRTVNQLLIWASAVNELHGPDKARELLKNSLITHYNVPRAPMAELDAQPDPNYPW